MAEALLKSAYEVARDQRLQRNKEIMASLGLLHGDSTDPTEDKPCEDGSEGEVKSQTRIRLPKAKQEATRRSKRVQGLGPDGLPIPVSSAESSRGLDEDDVDMRMELKIARLKALHEENKTTYKNQTATYEHTWMRVRTMNDQALARRIKVIENALGQHCVVKMRMFAEVLVLAEKFELAKQAEESLNRLLELGLK